MPRNPETLMIGSLTPLAPLDRIWLPCRIYSPAESAADGCRSTSVLEPRTKRAPVAGGDCPGTHVGRRGRGADRPAGEGNHRAAEKRVSAARRTAGHARGSRWN